MDSVAGGFLSLFYSAFFGGGSVFCSNLVPYGDGGDGFGLRLVIFIAGSNEVSFD